MLEMDALGTKILRLPKPEHNRLKHALRDREQLTPSPKSPPCTSAPAQGFNVIEAAARFHFGERNLNWTHYSTTRLMIALSDATTIVWVLLVCMSSIPLLQAKPAESPVAVIAILLGTLVYISSIAFLSRSRSDAPSRPGGG
jgi:hypothetical protein